MSDLSLNLSPEQRAALLLRGTPRRTAQDDWAYELLRRFLDGDSFADENAIGPCNELVYVRRSGDGDVWISYRPRGGTLNVDGMTYTPDSGRWTAAPMVSFKTDEGGDPARMMCSRPPTEEDLDDWVKHGDTNHPHFGVVV